MVEALPEPETDLLDENIAFLECGLRRHHRLGVLAFVALLSMVIFWAWIMPLAGAVVVGGTFVVHSSAKKVQHKSGGIVMEIPVHDGSKVKTGDLLVRLDDTDARAVVAAIARQIDETKLRIARLTAERDGSAVVAAPPKYLSTAEERQKMARAELDFFNARRKNQQGVQQLAASRITQLQKQIKGLQAQLAANKQQKDITNTELAGMETLFKKKIAPISRLTPLQREKARLEGSDNVIASSEQETNDKIAETKLQAEQSKQAFHSEVLHDLTEASAKLGLLTEQYIVAAQTLVRSNIIAPASGLVNEMSVHTVGGVVAPGETLMTIIPDDDHLEVAIKLASDRIDQVRMNQVARVKLTAFERTTPDIEGNVSFISPDLIETKLGSYYDVRIAVDQHPRGVTLSPGMPAEVFIKTDERTMMSYLFKPVIENFNRAFRER